MSKIGVLGCGTMGSGIAQMAALSGCQVVLVDIKEELVDKGIKNIEKSLERMLNKNRITLKNKKDTLERIWGTVDMARFKGCEIVIEAVTEKMEIKKQVFKKLDEVCEADTILASNTSALSITELASQTKRPDKVMGAHFFNPVPIMKLVELTRTLLTSQETYQKVHDFVTKLGKTPVEVEEAPGFIVNRILVPMINEAAFVLNEGIASARDIDTAMKLGANHPIGPLALADLIGLDVCLSIMETLYRELGDPKYRPCPLLRKKVRSGQLGRKTGEGFFRYN